MPTLDAASYSATQPQTSLAHWSESALPLALVTLLTPLGLAVHGYHPYAEDGGLYGAGIKRLLDPALYPQSILFVEAHLRFSLFAPAVAGLVRLTHLGLPAVLLSLHLAAIWTTLFAVWLLAARCYASPTARAGAVTLMAAWLTLPVAGTSLILVDPYLTARSFSLPCALLALAGALDFTTAATHRGRFAGAALCCLPLVVAALLHPLIAGYALGDVFLVAAWSSRHQQSRLRRTLLLCGFAVALAAALQLAAPAEPSGYMDVAVTRYYWFLSRWKWFELVGLIAPLLILAVKARIPWPSGYDEAWDTCLRQRHVLARAILASGITAILIALALCHERAATHLVARLQPLRTFQIVYAVMILMLGAWLGEHVLRRSLWRWVGVFTALGCLMGFVQANTYPASAHIEWPEAAPRNQWQQAFLWISRSTPTGALFALDADYTSKPGEDVQGFRAIAERSALPDYSKDGGEASITPGLTAAWTRGQAAQAGLSSMPDAQRLAVLQPFHLDWIVLLQNARTAFDCPYSNSSVKVCRLP